MTELTRPQALKKLLELTRTLMGGGSGRHAISLRLADIADALAKPAIGLDWQPGNTLKDLPERLHRTEILVRLSPDRDYDTFYWQDLRQTDLGLKIYNGTATPEEIEEAFGRYHGWAEIPNGIAKPEARLDWQGGEKFKDQYPGRMFVVEYLSSAGQPDRTVTSPERANTDRLDVIRFAEILLSTPQESPAKAKLVVVGMGAAELSNGQTVDIAFPAPAPQESPATTPSKPVVTGSASAEVAGGSARTCDDCKYGHTCGLPSHWYKAGWTCDEKE